MEVNFGVNTSFKAIDFFLVLGKVAIDAVVLDTSNRNEIVGLFW